jgi:glycosyltransferase involved in cell wall biosynthesis
MRQAKGLIVQTQLLRDYFTGVLGETVHLVPGYRDVSAIEHEEPPIRQSATPLRPLRLVFLGHVREEKGIFVLLESLRQLHASGQSIECDIWGPVYDDVVARFQTELSSVPNSRYMGVVKPDEVIATLRRYDVLAFPSYFTGEGHPGVLIEAMVAGIAVIATRFRSIPEIVPDSVRGLLVQPRDPNDLATAIRRLAEDRRLLDELGRNSFAARDQFTASEVVPRILQTMAV